MSFDDISGRQMTVADSLRGTLIGAVLSTAGDDLTELLDGAAHSEQALDAAVWLGDHEQNGELGKSVQAVIDELQARLAGLGVMAKLYIGSPAGLFEERTKCRERLYGKPAHAADRPE